MGKSTGSGATQAASDLGLALRLGYRDFSPSAGGSPLTALSPAAAILTDHSLSSARALADSDTPLGILRVVSARWLVVMPRWVHFKWSQPLPDSRFSWWSQYGGRSKYPTPPRLGTLYGVVKFFSKMHRACCSGTGPQRYRPCCSDHQQRNEGPACTHRRCPSAQARPSQNPHH